MSARTSSPAIWRYTAVAITGSRRRQEGELAGTSAAEVRAALRRIGLQAVEVRPLTTRLRAQSLADHGATPGALAMVRRRFEQHMRTRRRDQRAELFDSIATMLESGLPLIESIETIIAAPVANRSPTLKRLTQRSSTMHAMLVQVRESLRCGMSLDESLRDHPGWFDESEVAMVRAAQHAGNLHTVLQRLAEHQSRAGELGHRLMSALAYPAVVAAVGIGVALFLSMKTLPDLSRVLESAGLEVPALTMHVMAVGQFSGEYWPALLLAVTALAAAFWFAPAIFERRAGGKGMSVILPKVVRRIAVADFSLRLSELLRTGVPMVEALRVLAPTVTSAPLRSLLRTAADRVERGEDLSRALEDDRWFDGEYRRVVDIGQASGELDSLLERLGKRYERTARRLIDRLTALLEPIVILTLAALIGIVVMSAVLPLTRLQEVLR